MKILHVMHNDKFIKPYIKFINDNFNKEEHYFLIISGVSKEIIQVPNYSNVHYINDLKIKNKTLQVFLSFLPLSYILVKNSLGSNKIYFHSFHNKRMILFLFIFRKFLKKSNWIVWGGDLYEYEERKDSFVNKIWYKIEDYVKSNIAYVNTLVPEDYKKAKEYYLIKGKYKKAQYVSDINFNFIDSLIPDKKEEIYIQIGNSATSSNNHFEIIDTLSKFKNEKIKIFCILSYGDKEYGKKVAEYGEQIFGNKFIGIFDFMPINKYWNYLKNIDILVLDHNRQQGLGNITMLSYFEKKIYLRDDISSWSYLTQDIGLKLNSFENIKNETFEEFLKNNAFGNKEKLKKTVYSNEYRKKLWEDNFNN